VGKDEDPARPPEPRLGELKTSLREGHWAKKKNPNRGVPPGQGESPLLFCLALSRSREKPLKGGKRGESHQDNTEGTTIGRNYQQGAQSPFKVIARFTILITRMSKAQTQRGGRAIKRGRRAEAQRRQVNPQPLQKVQTEKTSGGGRRRREKPGLVKTKSDVRKVRRGPIA